MLVVAVRFLGLARHDFVDPAAAEDGSEEIAQGAGDIQEAEDEGREVVRGLGEGGLQGDVEEVQGAEGDAGVVDGEGDRREAHPGENDERVNEDAVEVLEEGFCFLLYGLAGAGAGEVVGGAMLFGGGVGGWEGGFLLDGQSLGEAEDDKDDG